MASATRFRYELSDRVRFSGEAASDLGPFRLLDTIEGREEDILSLPAREGGSVRVHPNLSHRVDYDIAPDQPLREWAGARVAVGRCRVISSL